LLLLALHRNEDLPAGERTLLMNDPESLPLCAGQAVIDRGKLFQVPSQRCGKKRESGRVGRDETLDFRGIRGCERSPRQLCGSILRLTGR
jgi:hypothetical protein